MSRHNNLISGYRAVVEAAHAFGRFLGRRRERAAHTVSLVVVDPVPC